MKRSWKPTNGLKMFSLKKLFLNVLFSFAIITILLKPSFAQSSMVQAINNVINSSEISKKAIVSVCIQNQKNGEVVYSRNSWVLLHPASTLKIFSNATAFYTLGKDNFISTKIYQNGNSLYLKLGADPLLTQEDLFNLFDFALNSPQIDSFKEIVIDDSIIDDKEWGEGWMWDDNTSPYIPKYSSYNINENLTELTIIPTSLNKPPRLYSDSMLRVQNNVLTSEKTKLKFDRRYWKKDPKLEVSGTIDGEIKLKVPVDSPEDLFLFKLNQILYSLNIGHVKIKKAQTPIEARLLASVGHSVNEIVSKANKKSDNLSAETLLILAGGTHTSLTGTTKAGLDVFEKFYTALGLDFADINIVDASGVSHNNLITTEWMSNALYKLSKLPDFTSFKATLAIPAEKGTLKYRLVSLKNNIRAKTGTLAAASGLSGYLKSGSGKDYCFSILIQNFTGSSALAKRLEDQIVLTLYKF